jgi:hypothetical protein
MNVKRLTEPVQSTNPILSSRPVSAYDNRTMLDVVESLEGVWQDSSCRVKLCFIRRNGHASLEQL